MKEVPVLLTIFLPPHLFNKPLQQTKKIETTHRRRIGSICSMKLFCRPISFAALLLGFSSTLMAQQSITAVPVKQPIQLDGKPQEWANVKTTRVTLRALHNQSSVETRHVDVQASYDNENIYFLLRWPDSEASETHKPWLWSQPQQRYLSGTIYEDRLAMQFAISGNFNADWTRAKEFTADMWHWKASRSNPLGLVHDKFTQVSRKELKLSNVIPAADGGKVYVLRKNDEGTPLYTTRRYRRHQADIMPKYYLNSEPSGSIADIQAKGIWQDGHWTLELKRKLNTGHKDDVRFRAGQSVNGAIAIYDASANHDHVVSDTLKFMLSTEQ